MVNINTASSQIEIRHSVLVGDTSDVFQQRTLTILRNENINPTVTMEFFPERDGLLCGIREVRSLLERVLPETGIEVWALDEGDGVAAKEVALRIRAPYNSFGLYETIICGILSSCTGWATAARECVDAADGVPIIATPAKHIHPNVAPPVEYAAVVGGCASCSTKTCPGTTRSPRGSSRSGGKKRARGGSSPERAARPAPTGGSTCSRNPRKPRGSRWPSTA